MTKNYALVLGGGGGKGAYQIGVWQALKEYGLVKHIGAVAGTSVGALNTALFVQADLELALQAWKSVDNDKILHLDKSRTLQSLKNFKLSRIFGDGIFSNNGLLELISTYSDLEIISQAEIPAFATCCPLPEFSFKNLRLPDPVYFRLNGRPPEEIKSILLASSAIPFVFDAIEIQGKGYVDGGLVDNLPIRPLYDLGFRRFIVINLDMYQRLPREKYRDADIIEIMPEHSRTENITDILSFSPEQIQTHIQAGYKDAVLTLSSRFKRPGQFIQKLKSLFSHQKISGEE